METIMCTVHGFRSKRDWDDKKQKAEKKEEDVIRYQNWYKWQNKIFYGAQVTMVAGCNIL